MQKIIDNGTTVLLADEGMKLTDYNTFGTTVRLGKEDSADSWHEITEAEYEALMESATDENTATEADYQAALREMGVKV